MKTRNLTSSIFPSFVAIGFMFYTGLSIAQEGKHQQPILVAASALPSSDAGKNCVAADLTYLLDVTGSFTDHLLHKDLFSAAINRIRTDAPRLCIGSEVRVAIIGHSHRDVSGSYDHLAASRYTVSRNHYSAENVNAVVVKQLEKWRDDLASGKMKPQHNTAVAMAFDNVAEIAQLRGRPNFIWAITDGDETELGGVPAPFKPNQLVGATVYMLGAGVTLSDGTLGQRKLRTEWERYFRQAGVEKFYWVSKP